MGSLPVDLRTRPYRPSDLPACLAVFDSNVPEWFSVEERDGFVAFLTDLPGPYLVLERRRRRVVGCGGWALRDDGRTADLCWGMVRRERHRNGLGRILTLERLAAIDRSGDVDRVELQTSQHTVGFYERLGFAAVSREPDGFAPGIDRIVMARG